MEHLMSQETSEMFFNFMKKMGCTCDEMEKANIPEEFRFKTSLDLCDFETASEFMESQVGDRQLPDNNES